MESTIKKITKISDPSEKFEMYTISVDLEDGKSGMAFCKAFPPPYQFGDAVEYAITGTTKQGKTKLGIKKLKGGYSGGSQPARSDSRASSASPRGSSSNGGEGNAKSGAIFNKAIDMLIASKSDQTEENAKRCVELSFCAMNYAIELTHGAGQAELPIKQEWTPTPPRKPAPIIEEDEELDVPF